MKIEYNSYFLNLYSILSLVFGTLIIYFPEYTIAHFLKTT